MQQQQEAIAKPAPVIIPEEQIKEIVEEKWSKLIGKFEDSIKEQINPMKTWMDELQEQSLLRIMENDTKFNEVKKAVEKSEANLILYKKELN